MWRIAQWPVCLTLVAGTWACAPLSPTPPFHLAETAKVLPNGRVGLSGAVGGGNFKTIGAGVGMNGRLRVGVGDASEVGAEASIVRRTNDDDPTPERPWLGPSTAYLYKAAWKLSLAPWLAAIAGAGGSHSATGNALGGDLALVGSTPDLLAERFRPYLGARGGVAVPVGRDRDDAGGTTEAVTIAGGSTWELTPDFHLLLELGFLYEWNKGYFSTEVDPDRMIQRQSHPGGYIALGGGLEF